ncbi:MAG: recombinase family protein [Dehalococcoidia bacterium]
MTRNHKIAPTMSQLRCAIYTRKSSEEGLDQSFNSLDAQREACEAYIMSQAGEGWTAIPTRYDDGGYSGGSMERPGLKRLLADIARRKVDVVVVYKVDRLTRNLADFAKMVEIFDGHGVSFVSVTQAFNTTTSMGRLTLNVLLSFAQFEREVTGERIRDKIAASKKKGMWMGGTPPLGYRAAGRTLAIEQTESVTVRHIFDRYLALGSVHALKGELDAQGIRPRPSKRTGSEAAAFGRGALYHLLSNRLYLGEIVHKDQSYPGQHPAIVDCEIFGAAAKLLAANRQERRDRAVTVSRAPLTGLIFDAEGEPLCPVSARNSRGRVYRYYVSSHLQQGGRKGDNYKSDNSNGLRIPAPAIEALVLGRLQRLVSVTDWDTARQQLVRVDVDSEATTITTRVAGRVSLKNIDPVDRVVEREDGMAEIHIAMQLTRWAGRTEIVRAGNQRLVGEVRIDRSLVRGLARAHALVRTAKASPGRTIEEVGASQGATESYVRRLSRLAFLAPDIQQAIIDGRQPVVVNLERLMRIDLPLDWNEQRRLLGFAIV